MAQLTFAIKKTSYYFFIYSYYKLFQRIFGTIL